MAPQNASSARVLYSVPFEILTIGPALAAFGIILLLKRSLDAAVAKRGWNADRAVALLWLGPPILAAVISWLFVPVFLARTCRARWLRHIWRSAAESSGPRTNANVG